MDFRILGPVEAVREGVRAELGGLRQRAVLAALLIDANRMVSTDRLVGALWPDRQPARATATVQVFVSNLRRALEPDRERGAPAQVLTTRGAGYLLVVEPESLDAHVFETLAEQGRIVLADGEPEHAAQLLDRAAGMWRGPALADVAGEPFAAAEAARLEELRLCCEEDRAEAALELGRHRSAVADLERIVGAHPLRERPRGQLMLALYRSGRQAQALAVARQGRRVLSDELGLDPAAPLQALEGAILRQDPTLDLPVDAPARAAATGGRDEPGRVLVVDDSAINRRLLVAALRGLGHAVTTAEHGQRALELLRAGPRHDVVLLDLLMPVLDGYATLETIKADPALRHLPVIMVSAVHELESVVRCIELGATDYLTKPFSADVLRARLRSSLAAKRLRDAELDDLTRTGEALREFERLAREVQARETALRHEIDRLRAQLDAGRSA